MVHGSTPEEHDSRLAAVLDKLNQHQVTLNQSKCVFGTNEIGFLGFMSPMLVRDHFDLMSMPF